MRLRSLKSISIAGMTITAITIGLPVLASSFEWMNYVKGTQTGTCPGFASCKFDSRTAGGTNNALKANRTTNLTFHSSSTGAYTEYRSVYYYVTSTKTWTPTSTWATWTEHTGCRKNGVLPGSGSNRGITDTCTATTTASAATSTIWYRATINYSGCGTWTPTPTTTCGGFKQASSTFLP